MVRSAGPAATSPGASRRMLSPGAHLPLDEPSGGESIGRWYRSHVSRRDCRVCSCARLARRGRWDSRRSARVLATRPGADRQHDCRNLSCVPVVMESVNECVAIECTSKQERRHNEVHFERSSILGPNETTIATACASLDFSMRSTPGIDTLVSPIPSCNGLGFPARGSIVRLDQGKLRFNLSSRPSRRRYRRSTNERRIGTDDA